MRAAVLPVGESCSHQNASCVMGHQLQHNKCLTRSELHSLVWMPGRQTACARRNCSLHCLMVMCVGWLWPAVFYEELVERPESVAMQLLSACGLPWEPGVLSFHETDRPIQTASTEQVRGNGAYALAAGCLLHVSSQNELRVWHRDIYIV